MSVEARDAAPRICRIHRTDDGVSPDPTPELARGNYALCHLAARGTN